MASRKSECKCELFELVHQAICAAVVEALSEIDLEQCVVEGIRMATDESIEYTVAKLIGKQWRGDPVN